MSHCFAPDCTRPHNTNDDRYCRFCGTTLLLQQRYRAIRPLSAGGFSRTFLGIDLGDGNRECVIKQFHCPTLEGEAYQKAIDLFEREIERLQELGPHPLIPDFYAAIEQDGRSYIVQEWVDGLTLEQELAQNTAMSEAQILQILKELLPVLHFIHEHRVIHRDIKPANIVRRTCDRQLMLIDFGAAKVVDNASMHSSDTRIGSAGYAAPEQLYGQASFATDIYSLGVTCLHLLTAIEPFDLYDCNEGKFVWRHFLVDKTISGELGRVLDRMTAAAPMQRYSSAIAVMEALRMRDRPTTKQSASLPCAATKALKCQPVCTLGGRGAAVFSLAFSPDSYLLTAGYGGRLGRAIGNAGAIHTWQISNQKLVEEYDWYNGTVWAIAYSPDGERLATSGSSWLGGAGAIHIWDFEAEKLNPVGGYRGLVQNLAFSADGRWLGGGSGSGFANPDNVMPPGGVYLWDVATQRLVNSFSSRAINVPIAFSSNGEWLAFGNCSEWKEGFIWLRHLQEEENYCLSDKLLAERGLVQSIAFSPDSSLLATSGFGGGLQLWDVADGKLLKILSTLPSQPPFGAIAFTPNGQFLAATCSDNSIGLWNIESGRMAARLGGATFKAIAFSPDGQYLAAGSTQGKVYIWRYQQPAKTA